MLNCLWLFVSKSDLQKAISDVISRSRTASIRFDKSGLFVFTVEVYDALYPSLWAQSDKSEGLAWEENSRHLGVFDSFLIPYWRRNHLHVSMPIGNVKDNS